MPNAIVFAPLETYWKGVKTAKWRGPEEETWGRSRLHPPLPCCVAPQTSFLLPAPHTTYLPQPHPRLHDLFLTGEGKPCKPSPRGWSLGSAEAARNNIPGRPCALSAFTSSFTPQHGRTPTKRLCGNRARAASPPELRLLLKACFLRLGSQTRNSKSITRG